MNIPAPHVRIFQEGEEVWYITGDGLAKIGKVVSDAVMSNVRIPSFIFLFFYQTQAAHYKTQGACIVTVRVGTHVVAFPAEAFCCTS
jgi:hypothetical protein